MVTWKDELSADGDTYTLWYSTNGTNWSVLHLDAIAVVRGSFGFNFSGETMSMWFKPIETVEECRFCLTLDVGTLLESEIGTDKVKSKIVTVIVP